MKYVRSYELFSFLLIVLNSQYNYQVNNSSPSFTSLTLTTSTDPAPLVSLRTDSSTSRNVPGSTSKTCSTCYHDSSDHYKNVHSSHTVYVKISQDLDFTRKANLKRIFVA